MYPHVYNNAQQAFEQLFEHILDDGRVKSGTKYIRNVNIELVRPDLNEIKTPWRKWSKKYAELEWDWYLSGNRDPKIVEERAKLWSKMKDDEGKVWSNYGWWWQQNDQLENCIKLLQKDELTRRAIISHYSPFIPIKDYEKDTPCNVVLNFYVEHGDLSVTIFARSIDLVFGFCNDQYCFSRLLMQMAGRLKLYVGSMHYMITDLHIYEKDFNRKTNYAKEIEEANASQGR
jgi:thymidylate synthase